jgi:hypothetical protein
MNDEVYEAMVKAGVARRLEEPIKKQNKKMLLAKGPLTC